MQKPQQGWGIDLEKKVEKLEADLASTKTALAKEVSLREKAQGEAVKARDDLKTANEKLSASQRKLNHVVKTSSEEAQRAVDALHRMVQGVGAEGGPPDLSVSLRENLKWLADELEGLEGLMDSGREFVCLETLRAFATSLRSAGCEHLGLAEPKGLKGTGLLIPKAMPLRKSSLTTFGLLTAETWHFFALLFRVLRFAFHPDSLVFGLFFVFGVFFTVVLSCFLG